jgi:hypothetical protein
MSRRPIGPLLLLLPLAALMSADQTRGQSSPDGYTYGYQTCVQGSEGPGISLRLRPYPNCNSRRPTYPFLEIHLREQPVPTNQRILIGETNSAFRCLGPKGACEWFSSGEVMFSRFEEVDSKGIHTDGWYELRFRSGPPETGRFTVDCVAPCG